MFFFSYFVDSLLDVRQSVGLASSSKDTEAIAVPAFVMAVKSIKTKWLRLGINAGKADVWATREKIVTFSLLS